MGWETRTHGGRYYTRSWRRNGRVIREYIGAGEAGEQAAAFDALTRDQRQGERAERLCEHSRLDDADAALTAWSAWVEAQLREALTAAGYHQHKRGEWRRKRGGTT